MNRRRILFVDDEIALLEGLKGRLHRLRSDWDLVFAISGPNAVTEMEAQPADVIVTDLRMPGMDGAELLGIVSQRWPETVRIVLSGFAEQEQTARLVPVAHQYLSKPCEPQRIENVIERCQQLQALLQDPQLRALVGRIRKLPAVPKTYARVRQALAEPSVSVNAVGKIVGADIAVSAKVLQVSNSAFYRLARRISRIDQAITYLGFATIRDLVMSVEVFSQWRGNPQLPTLRAEDLQTRSHKVACVARLLAEETAFADEAFLAGMLHEIGYLVLAQECGAELAAILADSERTGRPLVELEYERFGASHAEIGAYLLGLWGLPYSLVEAVARHHTPSRVQQTDFDVLGVLVLAEALCDGPPGEPGLDLEEYLARLKAPYDMNEARRRASTVFEVPVGNPA